MKNKFKKIITVLFVAVLAIACIALPISASDGGEIAEESFFGALFAEIKANSSEILSALTLACSCVLAFSYKNGLLPTVKKSVGGIGGAVSEIKESSDKTAKLVSEVENATKGGLENLSALLMTLTDGLGKLEERLGALESDGKAREKINAVITEQVSLLYDIFMSSSLPEYRKEAVCKRLEKMKASIGDEGGDKSEGQDEN